MARPARAEKVISGILYSSLQVDSSPFGRRRLQFFLIICRKAKDSPDFVRLRCLEIPVARPARAEKMISDSSLQRDPCAFGCRRRQS